MLIAHSLIIVERGVKMLIDIFREVRMQGGEAYIVGGYVRDMLLDRPSKDIDIEVYDLEESELKSILDKYGSAKLVGRAYPIYLLNNYEFSIPHRIVKQGEQEVFIADPKLSLLEAAKRRDLTINSLFYDPLIDEIIDIYNGREDLEEGVLRYVYANSFQQDPLRVLRVAEFKARLEFEVEGKTAVLCQSLAPQLLDIPKERIFLEFKKMLLQAKKPSIAFRWLQENKILKVLLPEIDNLIQIEQGEEYHPEGNVFEHTMLALDVLNVEERNISLMLAILYHDLAKIWTKAYRPGKGVTFYGHAEEGAKRLAYFLTKITEDKKLIDRVRGLVKYHMRPFDLKNNLTRRSVRRLAAEIDIPELLKLHKADVLGRKNQGRLDLSYIKQILEIYNQIKEQVDPIIKGRHLLDLGLEAGPKIGQVLDEIYQAQLQGEFLDLGSGIEYTKEYLQRNSNS